MNSIKSIYFLLILLISSSIFSQKGSTIIEPDYIKSIVFRPSRANAYFPIVKLGEPIRLSFDDINANENIYSYKIEHCDYNWNISNLASTEYTSGFAEDRIRDFENSFNTLQAYTHYQLQIPNENIRIKISGNYLISVLDEGDNIIFTRRFIVYQPKVTVGVTVHRSTDIVSISEKHSVQFIISNPNLRLNNPHENIKVALYQNGDWNSVIKNIKPKYIQGSQLLYNYVDEISYWAGNEFLYFDSKDIRNATNNITRVRLDDIFHTFLYTDEARGNNPYSFSPDINGNFVLRTINTDDIELEGDYSFVHFFLKYDANFENDDIYVYGNFNDWKINDENKMVYNSQTNYYEKTLLLKQGFYNYTYATANKNSKINTHAIEGSYYQTENDYNVIVYYRKFGEFYDQVIGIGTGNSQELQN
ncbi:MAG: DUF5103 domain-containing protein [Flavobacteriaceae bacterium]|nr:DUF5103 domain-containing protein [Flavobacteriaceae bacterium]